MHIVTKILVVFASVLCVLLAALTMAYSANADRIRAEYLAEVNRRVAAESAASSQVAAANAERQTLSQRAADLANTTASLEGQIRQLQSERAQLLVERRSAEVDRDAIKDQIAQLGATNKTQALLIENYRNEVTTLREQELAFRKREIELNDRLNDLESQREVLEGSVRALQEQLAEARRQIEQGGVAAGQAVLGAMGSAEPFVPSVTIRGRVTRVTTDMATGRPMATINVGSTNQVRENMKLAITRGDRFVANLVVRRVDLQWALGEVQYLQAGSQVQEGDVAQTLATR